MNKNALIVTSILKMVFKITFAIFVFVLLEFTLLTLLLPVTDKVPLIIKDLQSFFPLLAYMYLFIAAFYFGISLFLQIEIFPLEESVVPSGFKTWDMGQGSKVEDNQVSTGSQAVPTLKMKFIIPKRKVGKMSSVTTFLPLQVFKQSKSKLRFLNVLRVNVPSNFKQGELVLVPNGGLYQKKNGMNGNLLLEMKFLSSLQSFLLILAQIFCLAMPVIIFYVFYL